MTSSCFSINGYYCGFVNLTDAPEDEEDIADYLSRRVQSKPKVAALIHGDISGFTVSTSKLRIFPARLISGYIALNNSLKTIALRHIASNETRAGYRFFAFDDTDKQDSFIAILDQILDKNAEWYQKHPPIKPKPNIIISQPARRNDPMQRITAAQSPFALSGGENHYSTNIKPNRRHRRDMHPIPDSCFKISYR